MSGKEAGTELTATGNGAAPAAPYEPRIIGFLCNWCAYAGADKAGVLQEPFAANLHVVRVMCSGRVEPRLIMRAFAAGAAGVLVLACHPGDCHYKEGNLKAAGRMTLLKRLLIQFGIGESRCRFDYVSAAEGEKYRRVIGDMVKELQASGPLNTAKAKEVQNECTAA